MEVCMGSDIRVSMEQPGDLTMFTTFSHDNPPITPDADGFSSVFGIQEMESLLFLIFL